MSPRRRTLFLTLALLVAVVSIFIVVRVITSGTSRGVPGNVDPNRRGTVVLVPGYGGSQATLETLAARLRAAGRTTVIVTLPGNGDGDLANQADALDSTVRAQLATGAPSVDLIGYSAGGVVVRLWIARYDTARAARRVVSLGSPLHGASIAAVGSAVLPGLCPTACQQLVPGSSLLSQLDAQPLPASLPWLSLWTADDQTVTPPTSARLDGAVNVELQSVCPDETVQHGQLPTDPLVIGLVLRALDSSQPLRAAPGPADCQQLRTAGGS
jgi:triacylglycerol esterase/lipase EstA (alpha/beta hydrolase family)